MKYHLQSYNSLQRTNLIPQRCIGNEELFPLPEFSARGGTNHGKQRHTLKKNNHINRTIKRKLAAPSHEELALYSRIKAARTAGSSSMTEWRHHLVPGASSRTESHNGRLEPSLKLHHSHSQSPFRTGGVL